VIFPLVNHISAMNVAGKHQIVRGLYILVVIFALTILCSMKVVSSMQLPLKGFQRRALRAISNRLKQQQGIVILQCDEVPSDNFMNNLNDVMRSRELVQLRMDVEKKKEAKVLGEKLAQETSSELVQVLGHTVLLFKSCGPDGAVTKMMEVEVAKDIYQKDKEK
jgi:RNA-binding protein YhbY